MIKKFRVATETFRFLFCQGLAVFLISPPGADLFVRKLYPCGRVFRTEDYGRLFRTEEFPSGRPFRTQESFVRKSLRYGVSLFGGHSGHLFFLAGATVSASRFLIHNFLIGPAVCRHPGEALFAYHLAVSLSLLTCFACCGSIHSELLAIDLSVNGILTNSGNI